MADKIDEEIRQFKLYKIQSTESKVREYKEIHNSIKESIVVKFTKNTTSNLLRLVFGIITFVFILMGIAFFFPEAIINFTDNGDNTLSELEEIDFKENAKYLGLAFLGIAFLFWLIGVLLKHNIRKRNTIYQLSNLLEEVIDYMEASTTEEKKKYEYFVDSIKERADKKEDGTKTHPRQR